MPDPDALSRLAARQAYGGLPDRRLLDRFAADRDEAAFAALVERHGPAVLDVARAVVRHAEDAEDVFQAAFLVLARRAASLRNPDTLACWLHGVARRLALKVARARTRRARYEAAARPAPATGDDPTWSEVRALVHDELARLPEALRAPVLLCHLEGLTLDEAAARLGLPRGTLRGRLDRARAVLRRRLARHGLPATAFVFPDPVARAVPPLIVLATARSAVRFAAGSGEPGRAAELAAGALPMTPSRTKLCLLLVVTLSAVGLGVAGTGTPDAPPPPPPAAGGGGPNPAAPGGGGPNPAPAVGFQVVTVVITPSWRGYAPADTVRISATGECLYEVPDRPARGTEPAWPGARIVHKLPPARLRELNDLLKETDWLAKSTKAVMRLHPTQYDITLKRDGTTATVSFEGEPEAYAKLLTFARTVAAQESLLYRLEWAPAAQVEGRRELDRLVGAELGEPTTKSQYPIDLTRYVPWARRLVRTPFGESADDVRAAVRLVGLLRLEAEREFLADLASDRDSSVRTAVAAAVGRLGGEKSVPVLRKMVRSTGIAAWELIKQGEVAVPTIAAVIREGKGPEDLSYEWLIRAYIEHWAEVPKPLDAAVLEAVRTSMTVPRVQGHRIGYHQELLRLAARPDRKE